jgi:hypothetical protein
MRALARDVGFSAQPNPEDGNEIIYSLDLRHSPVSRS